MEQKNNIQKTVKQAYGKIASTHYSCCSPSSCSSCSNEYLERVGYSAEEIASIPENANMALSCGNPVGVASLNAGETVLDLGCGAGADCFLAAKLVGAAGKVIGVDMTPEMIDRARKNAKEGHFNNVEFRLGEIENLPLADSSVDIIISNCVINLTADKTRAFEEIYRVLKPTGRISISDIALTKELPPSVKTSEQAYIGCIAGALLVEDYKQLVMERGFRRVEVIVQDNTACLDSFTNDPLAQELLGGNESLRKMLGNIVKSIIIKGEK